MYNYNTEKGNFTPHHSIHLHGHGFVVMSVGFGPLNAGQGTNNPDIVCDSASCASASWNKSRNVYVMQS